jgi:hypothetical protein
MQKARLCIPASSAFQCSLCFWAHSTADAAAAATAAAAAAAAAAGANLPSSIASSHPPLLPPHACSVHTQEYVQKVKAYSEDTSKGIHQVGGQATFSPGGYDIAALSAGGALTALDAVMAGECRNAYALVRPPGHHAGNLSVCSPHALPQCNAHLRGLPQHRPRGQCHTSSPSVPPACFMLGVRNVVQERLLSTAAGDVPLGTAATLRTAWHLARASTLRLHMHNALRVCWGAQHQTQARAPDRTGGTTLQPRLQVHARDRQYRWCGSTAASSIL